MKIIIELTEAQVKGIKAYLKAVDDIKNPTKENIAKEINHIVKSYLQAPQSSLTDYISEFENNL